MKSVLFYLKPEFSLEVAKKELLKLGLQNLFVIEDVESESIWLGGMVHSMPSSKTLLSVQLHGPNEIDWHAQWESFAEEFYNGVAHIDLKKFGKKKVLHLLPGEGFGDLSHPTTYIMLEMMKDLQLDNPIIDIGAGSGILTIAAKLMGATEIFGIEIDPLALRHAQKNALKNNLKIPFKSKLDIDLVKNHTTVFMNMTLAEQEAFIREFLTPDKKQLKLNQFVRLWVVSGILKEQKKEYLHLTKQWNWELLEQVQKENWLGFIFKSK